MLEPGRKNAFTIIELLTVMAIIIVLASLLVPNLMSSRARAVEAAALAELTQIDTALDRYYFDQGAYPEDAVADFSSSVLVDTLKGGLNQKTYYSFNAKRIKNGKYYSALDKPYFYRENWSETPKIADMHNPDRFDLWTDDRKGEAAGLNNWGGKGGAADAGGGEEEGGGEEPPPPPPPPS